VLSPYAFLDDFDSTVIVAVITMWMVQVTFDEIINVITMGHRLVSTTRAVFMARFMAATVMIGRAPIGILQPDFYHVLFDERRVSGSGGTMQVSVVKVIDVTCVFDRGVATLWTVLVTLVRMNFWIFHNKHLVNQNVSYQGRMFPNQRTTTSGKACPFEKSPKAQLN
jgi:hypothetical protein